ncbi:hypothetical protein D0962_20575 [Leptolyngbyaceae cyanobacterium CCMR0082]|uniref:Uncharacterized protein n=1 Tax=Adonisia turfae CCMR0082 TaxID=2304604 RepID=A0A6M0S9Q0_9CYAN|nr:hypothetical protein [Adonisia turfae]NEZ65140.1 hypothetical protein [Adonisia turfae CCMR0082]
MKQLPNFERLLATVRQKQPLVIRTINRYWQYKDLKHLGFLIAHAIGYVGYILFTLSCCFTLGLALWALNFIRRDALGPGIFAKGDESSPNPLRWLLLALLWLLMALFKLFAGWMGWGAEKTKPGDVLWIMLKAIPLRLAPNPFTAWFSIPTILVALWWGLATLIPGS